MIKRLVAKSPSKRVRLDFSVKILLRLSASVKVIPRFATSFLQEEDIQASDECLASQQKENTTEQTANRRPHTGQDHNQTPRRRNIVGNANCCTMWPSADAGGRYASCHRSQPGELHRARQDGINNSSWTQVVKSFFLPHVSFTAGEIWDD